MDIQLGISPLSNSCIASAALHPTVPYSAQLNLDPLWTESTGDQEVCVAVLDGPVDLSHPCFSAANLSVVESLAPNAVDQGFASQHGTHIASIIFGAHSTPIRGVAPGCRGLVIPVFKSGSGDQLRPCSQLDLARAITLAVNHGAHVINISGGQLDPGGEASPWLGDAVRMCAEKGVIVVAAAGNDGCACLHVPAGEPSVLVVGAMDSGGDPMEFSNWGEAYHARGVLAPGVDVIGASPGGGFSARTGTSFATPIVSGVVALLLSIQIKRGERRDPRSVRQAIVDSATGCAVQPVPDCSRLLAGRLNPAGALSHLNKGGIVKMSEFTEELSDPETATDSPGTESFEPSLLPSSEIQTRTSPANIGTGTASAPGIAVQRAPVQSSHPAHALGAINPSSSCGCGGGGGSGGGCSCGTKTRAALVYALGEIGYDFGTEARRDSLLSQSGHNLLDPLQLLEYLGRNPADAAAIIWTLSVDATPIYALQPAGPFAVETYNRVREFLGAQLKEGANRVSVPGYSTGSVTLLNGQTVPLVIPELRGMYSWSTQVLIDAVCGKPEGKKGEGQRDQKEREEKEEDIRNFLDRVYYEIRNLGLAPQERAVNYAATNAFQIETVYRNAITHNLKLDSIQVERSPICRPESDCWDVKLTFFNPHKRMEEARNVYRFTVDVSDVVPVTVGKVRSWRVF